MKYMSFSGSPSNWSSCFNAIITSRTGKCIYLLVETRSFLNG